MIAIPDHRPSPTMPSSWTVTGGSFGQGAGPMAWRIRLREDPLFFWATQLLPAPRARALYALHAFCREIEAIAHSEASASLKQALLSGWRSEIALLYEGRPRHPLARSLMGPVRLMASDAMTSSGLSTAGKRTAAPAGRHRAFPSWISIALKPPGASVFAMGILGLETPAAERIAAELGRAVRLTELLRDLSADAARNRRIPAARAAGGPWPPLGQPSLRIDPSCAGECLRRARHACGRALRGGRKGDRRQPVARSAGRRADSRHYGDSSGGPRPQAGSVWRSRIRLSARTQSEACAWLCACHGQILRNLEGERHRTAAVWRAPTAAGNSLSRPRIAYRLLQIHGISSARPPRRARTAHRHLRNPQESSHETFRASNHRSGLWGGKRGRPC